MVHVSTPRPSLGEALGNAIGGLGGQIAGQEYNRSRTRQDIDRLRQNSQNASPLDLAFNLTEAMALNPAIARGIGPLAQTLLPMMRANKMFPEGGQSGMQNQPPGQISQGMDLSTGAQNAPGQAQNQPIQGEANPQPPTTSGVLPRIMPAEEIQALSERAAREMGDPNAAITYQNYYNNQNQIAQQARQAAEQKAASLGVTPDEIPEFLQVGQQFGYEKDLDKWALKTQQAWDTYKNAKTKLDNADIPGWFRGLREGPKARETSLKRLEGTVQDLVKSGFENQTRNKLASEGLSPTEIEGLIFPMGTQIQKALDKFPKGTFPKEEPAGKEGYLNTKQPTFISYEEALEKAPKEMEVMQNRLSNFFKNNVNPDTSLLVLRHQLWNDKDYDWRQIGPAVRDAVQKGLKLSPKQQTELTELETQPPRQSIADVFKGYGRWIDLIRGNK